MWKGRDRIPAIIIKQLIPYEAWRRSKSGSEWARQLNGADGRGFSADGVTSDQLNTVHLLFKATRRSCHSTLETNNFFAVHSAIWRQKVMSESLFWDGFSCIRVVRYVCVYIRDDSCCVLCVYTNMFCWDALDGADKSQLAVHKRTQNSHKHKHKNTQNPTSISSHGTGACPSKMIALHALS